MSYESRRYKEGLDGQKPGWITVDEKGHRAQEAGYRDYLRNKDLAELLHERSEQDGGGWPAAAPLKPLEPWQRVLWFGIGCALVRWSVLLAIWITNGVNAGRPEFNWPHFAFYFFVIPGGLLLWPGLLCIRMAFGKDE